MHTVLLSLVPAAIVGVIVYGWNALFVILASILAAVGTEALFCLLTKRPLSITDGSAAVTGMLLALSLSPSTPVVYPILGAVFAILVAKCCFGGLGKNFINPALAGRCFLLMSFGATMTQFPGSDLTHSDGVGIAPFANTGIGNSAVHNHCTDRFLIQNPFFAELYRSRREKIGCKSTCKITISI